MTFVMVHQCFRVGSRLSEEEAGNEAQKGKCLNECDTQEHGGTQLASHLRLTCHAFEGLAYEDADAEAGADGGEAVANSAVVSDSSGRVCGGEVFCVWVFPFFFVPRVWSRGGFGFYVMGFVPG